MDPQALKVNDFGGFGGDLNAAFGFWGVDPIYHILVLTYHSPRIPS